MDAEPKKIHGAGFVLCRDTKSGPEFLLLKAKWGRHWSIPKGHISEGEDILATAYRETEEETGIESDEIKRIEGFSRVVTTELKRPTKNCPEGIKNTQVFIGVVDKDVEVLLSDEHTDYQWVKLVVVMRMLGKPFLEVIGEANRLIRSNSY